MALHNLARMTSATTGTGTLTLGSAVTGFLSFDDAGVANGEVVTYAIRDGSASEIGRGTYTTSGTTLSRTNIYESTNGGSAISCSGSQEVFITAAAENLWTAPTVTTVTTSNLAAAVNTRYILDVSGLTANRNFTVPAGAPGDWIEVNLSVGDDTYALIVIGDTSITINGGSAATEWSRLFITGESVRLVATSATNWQVIYDGRIPCEGKMTLSGADTTNTAATDTLPTWDTKVIDAGNLCDTTNYRFNLRRAGNYMVGGGAYPNGTLTDQNYYYVTIKQNSTAVGGGIQRASGNTNVGAFGMTEIVGAVNDAIYLYYTPQATNMGIANHQYTQFWIKEI